MSPSITDDNCCEASIRRLVRVGLLCLLVAGAAGCRLSANGHNIDGVRNLQLGNHHGAIQNFQRALASDPNNADAYYNLAAVYHDMGRRNSDNSLIEQAESLYHQCLDRDANHVDCHRALAVLLVQTERAQSAYTLLERWAMRSPQLAEPRVELARLYEEFGDKETAVRHLTEALDTDPRNSRAWTALGNLREQQGQLAQALSNYQRAYHLNQFQPGIGDRIARLQRSLGTSTDGLTPSGTRMVNAPNGATR